VSPVPVATVFASLLGVSSMFLVEHRGVLTVIDTGSPYTSTTRILRAVRKMGRNPENLRQIVLTHCHGDHAGQAKRLQEATGATVVAGRDDVGVIEGRDPYPGPKGLIPHAVYGRFGTYTRLTVDRAVAEREEIDGGLVVIPTPGHTAGHVSVFAPDLETLFIGDTIWSLGPVRPSWRPFTQDPARNQESIERLADLPTRRVHPGHGTPFGGEHIARLARGP
jgi:glyoxylase-like metal-dependent hydrolase (beta-lactamase superfamily II)